MMAGASSFGIHYLLLTRRFGALRRHLEVRTFVVCLLAFYALMAFALVRTDAYTSVDQLFRRGFFMLLSAQTTTGFATLPSRTLVSYWGPLAPAMIVAAMSIGAMSGSTGGGIKVARVGVIAKSLKQDVLRRLLPPDAVVVESYHAGIPRILRPEVVRLAAMVLLLFMLLYGTGALIGMLYEYPFDQAFFESVSAAGTVGLSVGLTGPSLETGLKILYIVQIWMGRLELVAVLALFGFVYSTVRGRL
jgi:trk system potassium uptake protein TrkH